MKGPQGDPRGLLEMADRLLGRAEPAMAGLWPRASALLGLQALEASLLRVWKTRALDLQGCTMRTQLICLRSYLEDPGLAARAGHAWSALSRACHHHPYELAPTSTELGSWLSVVGELVEKVEAAPPAAGPARV
ncbi:MAG TPA: hypothetical protein VLL75_00760 [Vicinamibacteria bacterium]|nr:hypothetical protein [Vicinamibacteria bacterium]